MSQEPVKVPECFISDHNGFCGTIKSYTRDFVVTEIDIDGQLVTNKALISSNSSHILGADDEEHKSLQPALGPLHRDIKEDTCNLLSVDCLEDQTSPNTEDETIPCPESLDLIVVLGLPVYQQLEQFVTTYKQTSEKAPNDGEESKTLSGRDCSLGSFPDKLLRASVHRAVRHHFPFLMTVTNQAEISVRADPDYRELSGLVAEEEAEDFYRFIDAKVPGSGYTFDPDDDKEHRTAVHHFLSRRFGKLVETKSFSDQEGRTSITVRLRDQGRPRKRTAKHSKDQDVYTAFVLRKENLETLEAISYMAAVLGVLPSDFSYAGIKDKRAVTFQDMVVRKVTPHRLREKTSELQKRAVVLSGARSVREPLRLGRLQGNHFDLLVRDLRSLGVTDTRVKRNAPACQSAQIELASLVHEAVENVRARGFVNYYGPQRFGTVQSVQSDRVGLALLKEDMVSAVRLFFTPAEGDEPQNQAKRLFLQTNNAKEALGLMPLSKSRERLMLRALHRYGTGTEGCTRAWLSLPHGMRAFYPHAYCSRVWNEAVAYRLSSLGHRPRQGDLVWALGGADKPQIHVVTTQEEESGVYTLAQVVLPMPGNNAKYPENAMGAWYQERLANDGLTGCRFRITALKLNLPGCHRHLLAFPRNCTYQLLGHQKVGDNDWGTVEETPGDGQGKREDGGRNASNDEKKRAGGECGGVSKADGQRDGVRVVEEDSPVLSLNFDLDASCYATVCLREVMKIDL